MKKIVLASSLVTALILTGCGGDRFSPKEEKTIVIKGASASLDTNTNTIVTDKDSTILSLVGEFGSVVFVNGKEVGSFSQSGSLDVTLALKDVGNYTYNVYSQNSSGIDSETITIEVIKKEKSASLGTVSTKGKANALTVSKNGTLFIAEKSNGVEIISIGYSDVIHSELVSIIDDIEAENVILSDDEKKLYIEDANGKFQVMDISDLNNPKIIETVDKIKKTLIAISEDETMQYRIADCGLVGESINNTENHEVKFILEDEGIQDIILVDNDTKLMIAHGVEGLQLLDLADVNNPTLVGEKDLGDNTSGLSLIKKDGILFVANGASGVQVFDLEVLIEKMKY